MKALWLTFLLWIAGTFGVEFCKENAELRYGQPHCQEKCSYLGGELCDTHESIGCFCEAGYILERTGGDCILLEDCPSKCKLRFIRFFRRIFIENLHFQLIINCHMMNE